MDTSWIELPKVHPNYIEGCKQFVDLAKESLVGGKTRCPCRKCKVDKWVPIDDVMGHLLFKGFDKEYKVWIFHEKGDVFEQTLGIDAGTSSGQSFDKSLRVFDQDDMGGLPKAAFGPIPYNDNMTNEVGGVPLDDMEGHTNIEQPVMPVSEENEKYKKLLEASTEELYPGCKNFSKLSFLLRLLNLKCMFHWSGESFTTLLKLLVDAFPEIMEFPQSYYEGKKMIKDLGLGYEKIDACPNDCILYWGELSHLDKCHVCNTSRWKMTRSKEDGAIEKKGEPSKVLRYFPLIPRLKRIYMSSKTAEDMRWHESHRVKDGMLRHPADALAWREFDQLYPDFASDPRNVRLGLASDGFNPYRLMNTTYSTWPVVLIPYNLPPWLCMKQSSFLLSSIIPGKSSPSMDIDVYLQPLLHELKLLWEGVDAFDAYSEENFKLRAALSWTINDFPAYAMLSGWSTSGYNACPICTYSTHSYRFGGRICYTGHRKWLPDNHPYRSQDELFDGTIEYDRAPIPATGSEILSQQGGINYVYGKANRHKRKRMKRQVNAGSSNIFQENDGGDDEDDTLWKKKSAFFELPYWEHVLVRHNLDVMHIEKNVCDNLLGTLLNMDSKNRDDERAREAIEELGLRSHLWLQVRSSGNQYMPPAKYSMSSEQKETFFKVLQGVRVPDGYGSNISRCVNMKQKKLMNLKSHDNHVLMQDLLPVALRASNATQVIDLLVDLSSFFKYICSTTLDVDELDNVQSKLILTLCGMEKEFLPTFFTIMVHLLVHLVNEAKLGGPVQYRWMYPIERYLSHLKSHVSNKAQPEGSIAEGYILEETITFCSRYLEGVQTALNRPKRNDDDIPNPNAYLFHSGGRVIGTEKNIRLDDKTVKQAHRYVLLHSDEMEEFLNAFIQQKKQEVDFRGGDDTSARSDWIIKDYANWLQNQVHNIDSTADGGKLKLALAGGMSIYAKSMKGFAINGYKFHTTDRERFRKTQNSGIMVEADGQEYYGKLKEIYEFDYFGDYKVVMFRCDWADIHKGIRTYPDGSCCVSFSKLMHTGRKLEDDPFIFSSQARQVFYVRDELQKGWSHVIKTKPRDLFDVGDMIP